MDSSFWYYAAITGAIILITWGLVLPKYDVQRRLNMWEYAVPNVLPYIIWTLTALLFMWGTIQAAQATSSSTDEWIYLIFFILTLLFAMLCIVIFLWTNKFIWALLCGILAWISIIILLLMYCPIDVINAWLGFPFFLMITYFVYIIWYAICTN